MHLTIAEINSDTTRLVAQNAEWAIDEYGPAVRGVMVAGGALDTSDAEIERCIGGCVGANLLMAVALAMRTSGIDMLTEDPAKVPRDLPFGFPVRNQ